MKKKLSSLLRVSSPGIDPPPSRHLNYYKIMRINEYKDLSGITEFYPYLVN